MPMNSVPQITHKNVLFISKTFRYIPTLGVLRVCCVSKKACLSSWDPRSAIHGNTLIFFCSKLFADIVCFGKLVARLFDRIFGQKLPRLAMKESNIPKLNSR